MYSSVYLLIPNSKFIPPPPFLFESNAVYKCYQNNTTVFRHDIKQGRVSLAAQMVKNLPAMQETKVSETWQIDGETMETVTDFCFLGLQNHCGW